MKKILALLMALVLVISCASAAKAVSGEREFFFRLSVDGSDTKQAKTGDIITVVFDLHRTDSEEAYDMYAMQNEIRYDSEFFKLVEGSAMLSDGISTTEIGLRDTFREFYMNFVSLSGGESWNAKKLIGSFQLEVIGDSGVTKITNQDYLVSTADGKDTYTTDVVFGQAITAPTAPTRTGFEFKGWTPAVGNMTEEGMTFTAVWEAARIPGGTASVNPANDSVLFRQQACQHPALRTRQAS